MKEIVIVWAVIAICASIAITEVWKDRRAEALRVCSNNVETPEQTIECTKAIFETEEQK